MARRSGFAPKCAALGTLLALLIGPACLNPMPEELPSHRESDSLDGPTGDTPTDEAAEGPGVPGLINDGASGSGNGAPQPAQSGGSDDDGEQPPADAGADAGALGIEDTGDTADAENLP